MKPMLACDWDESKVRFPVIAQPKIDGVRSLFLYGGMTGRSLKPHANRYTTSFFSQSLFHGFDGELAAEHECHPDLCRLTTSAVNTIEGTPYTLWHLFDYVVLGKTKELAYQDRLEALRARINTLLFTNHVESSRLRVVESHWCSNMDELLEKEDLWLDLGYEGAILRDPNGKYKDGRSTVREGGLLRIKRFIEEDAVVLAIEEGRTNLNQAQTNELGLQFRSTHAEGMVPNGQVGNMLCRVVKDVLDPVRGVVLLKAGQEITVAPGRMPVEDRAKYFKNPHLLIGQTIKFKFFPKGQKDKPRFPTFQSIRAASDTV